MRPGPSRRRFLQASAGGLAASLATAGAGPGAREYRRGGMVYRRLGQTGLWVSLLGFGSHTDPADRVPNPPYGTRLTPQGQARRDRLILHALDLGVNLLDVYHNEGQLEPAAKLVRSRRNRVLISLAQQISARSIDQACRLFGHIDLYRLYTGVIDGRARRLWDVLLKAKEAGKIRAVGVATHVEHTMVEALDELEGLDYFFFPYNFIYARAEYGEFLPAARRKGVGLIAMKPLAAGSIARLDPKARPGLQPESEAVQLWTRNTKPILPAVVAELTRSLDRMPDETLCMAALRFVYSKPFVCSAITGMFHDVLLEDDYRALSRYWELRPEERTALQAARSVARLRGPGWLAPRYRWLEEGWRAG